MLFDLWCYVTWFHLQQVNTICFFLLLLHSIDSIGENCLDLILISNYHEYITTAVWELVNEVGWFFFRFIYSDHEWIVRYGHRYSKSEIKKLKFCSYEIVYFVLCFCQLTCFPFHSQGQHLPNFESKLKWCDK